MATRITRPEFEAFVHPLIRDIVEATEKYNLPENAKKWFSDVSDGLITGIFIFMFKYLSMDPWHSHSTPMSSVVK